jgi:hypothetical protein
MKVAFVCRANIGLGGGLLRDVVFYQKFKGSVVGYLNGSATSNVLLIQNGLVARKILEALGIDSCGRNVSALVSITIKF